MLEPLVEQIRLEIEQILARERNLCRQLSWTDCYKEREGEDNTYVDRMAEDKLPEVTLNSRPTEWEVTQRQRRL
jgi:hypothetical protein